MFQISIQYGGKKKENYGVHSNFRVIAHIAGRRNYKTCDKAF